METTADLEAVRSKAIRDRKAATVLLNEAIAGGDKDSVTLFERQIDAIDRILGSLSIVLKRNEEVKAVAEETVKAKEIEIELMLEGVGITMEQLEKQEQILALREIDNKILKARAANDADAVTALEAQKRELELINRYKSQKFTDEEAATMAKEDVRLQQAAATAEQKRADEQERLNRLKGEGLRLSEEELAAAKRAAKMKEFGATRSETRIGAGGQREEVFFNEGRKLGTEDEIQARELRFNPNPSSETALQDITNPEPNTAPKASINTSGIERKIDQIRIDESPVIAALDRLELRINTSLSNLSSRIDEIGGN